MRDLISGDGIVLRPPSHADARRWFELFRDPEELRFGLPAFVTLPAIVEELIQSAQESWQAGEPATLVAADPGDDRFLGTVGWRLDAPPLLVADIGYGVHVDSRGQGVATRAVRALTRWLTLDDDGPALPRVQLDHSVENVASCRTALAAGYEQEGVRRGFLPLRDEAAPGGIRRHDVCLHGYLPGVS